MRLPGCIAFVLILPVAGALLTFFAGVADLFGAALWRSGGVDTAPFAAFFKNDVFLTILFRTHAMALCVAVLTLVIAYPVAAAMAVSRRAAAVMMLVVLLPLFSSIVVRSFGWMILLGSKGMLNWFWTLFFDARPLKLIYNFGGVLVGLVHVLLPFAVLAIYPVRANLPQSCIEASQTLGASPVRSFFHVTLRLVAPGLFNAFITVYLLAAGAIVTPLMLGGAANETMGSLIYNNMMRYFDFKLGAVYAVVLTGSCLLIVLAITLAERRVNRFMSAQR